MFLKAKLLKVAPFISLYLLTYLLTYLLRKNSDRGDFDRGPFDRMTLYLGGPTFGQIV